MAIKSIIQSGSKVEKFQGAIMKVGAANTMKLTSEALALIGVGLGDYVFVADGEEEGEFYVAGSKNERSASGAKGSKLGIVGDKDSVDVNNISQLQFSHALLGKKLFDVAAVLDVTEETQEFDGLNFHTMTIKQTREEANAEKATAEAAKQAKVDAEEDAATADADGGSRGRRTAE
jgi:hypothetical protein